MRKTGQAQKNQPIHHWFAHRNQGPFKNLPDRIKNQPWNLMPMPNRAFHNSIHGVGSNPFNIGQKMYYGTPQWAKATTGYVGSRATNELFNEGY